VKVKAIGWLFSSADVRHFEQTLEGVVEKHRVLHGLDADREHVNRDFQAFSDLLQEFAVHQD
jgi:50S ribosomal subunit-associated GTPase HflX